MDKKDETLVARSQKRVEEPSVDKSAEIFQLCPFKLYII